MISTLSHIRYRRLLFSVNDYFLVDKGAADADINYYIQCSVNVNNKLQEFYTLLVDLRQPLESISSKIYHRAWSEIQSFLQNQQYEHKVLFNLPDRELKYFIDQYDRFAENKQIRKAEKKRLQAYNNAGVLAISFIQQKGKYIWVNFYRVNQNRSSNLHSFSFENPEYTASHIGRVHRALHWLDIKYFKELNIRIYDFCGWYSGDTNKDLLNINKFKEQFTDHKVKEYTGVIYKNKLLLFLMKLRGHGK